MNLQSKHELEVTREKLQMLEEQYQRTRSKPGLDEHIRELTLHSLKKLINQLKEEIVRFEARMIKSARSD